MTFLLRLTFSVYLLVGCAASLAAIDWPIAPQDQAKPLGNSYGEYQNYGGFSYYHPGIDILATAGTPVYAVKAGYVKAVLTTSADLHWRVAIGDSAGADECDGWLYAHLNEATIAVMEGEWVEKGQYLGSLVYWPIASFHHLHFSKIRNSGIVWSSDWQFIANPLDELEVITDVVGPEFADAFGTQPFAFCQNESNSYFTVEEELAGDVDIICRADDMINDLWLLAPHRLEYKIDGDSSIPWTNSVCFTGLLNWNQNVAVVYRDDFFLNSQGDYDHRMFFFNLTNTDGDSLIEADDRARSWETANFHNGEYTVSARAYDRAGNMATTSMNITVGNYFTLDGSVVCADGNPQLEGSYITILSSGQADTASDDASFSIPLVGGGSQTIRFSRPGYVTVDTSLMMNQNHQLNINLAAVDFVRGDANFDDGINVGDVVYIINYVFKDGPSPRPYGAGEVNVDGTVNVGDAAYLINYIFRGGPPPAEPDKSLHAITW
jgi:hypothetical protein